LKLARNLLRDDGVIFIAIDDNESFNLRSLCNEVFGSENFVANIVWQHSIQPKGYSGTFSVHHNHILMFQKSDRFELGSLERTEEDNKAYGNPDSDPRGLWRAGDVRNALYRPNLRYDLKTPSGKSISPPENGWRWSRETMQSKIATGEIVFRDNEK
jgi:adenine-specific DNA-methyltransferase